MNVMALDELRRCGAMLQGHFRLSSGLHSPRYFQCALLFDDPQVGRRLTQSLARKVTHLGVERVVGVALGGILVGHELAAALGVRCCFAERDAAGRMTLRRGFKLRRGERVLVAEDVITTGKSVAEVAEAVRREGGVVVAQACLVHRDMGGVELAAPLVAVVEVEVQTWQQEDCPLCQQGLPVEKPGSRPTATA